MITQIVRNTDTNHVMDNKLYNVNCTKHPTANQSKPENADLVWKNKCNLALVMFLGMLCFKFILRTLWSIISYFGQLKKRNVSKLLKIQLQLVKPKAEIV